MKKLLIIMLALACTCTVFALQHSINVSVVPYTLQRSVSSLEGTKTIKSAYGWGLETSYQLYVVKGLFVEAGLDWSNYYYTHRDAKNFSTLMYYTGVGYKHPIVSFWTGMVHLDIAGDTLFYDHAASASISIKGGAGFDFQLNKTASITMKVDGTIGFARNGEKGIHYQNMRLVPMIGFTHTF